MIQKIIYLYKAIKNQGKDISNFNKEAYESSDVVKHYSSQNYLEKPEEAILNRFKDKLKDFKMLDIGVGGGRTTYHFANLTKEYIGIDFSENMVKICEQKFKNFPKTVSFKICDIRNMEIFNNNYFDFILFSFNGIDYISHENRLKALQEIKRVGKQGGFFFFSTHNLQSTDELFKFKSKFSIKDMLREIKKHFLLRLLNKSPKKLKNEKYAIVNDGEFDFRITTYYIKPSEQIKQLSDIGFRNISVYSIKDGQENRKESKLDTIKDNWLYYLCNI